MVTFESDSNNAAANRRRHGIAFEEAQSIFYDESAVQFFDQDNSNDEERFLLLGMSSDAKLLLICHCERDSGEVIRLISARKASAYEQETYLKR